MKDQLTLIAETDWDVLIILDACRADYFHEVCATAGSSSRACEIVKSPASCTRLWMHAARQVLERLAPLCFSANPVVEREIRRAKMRIRTVPLWECLWGYFTPQRIPSVHPMSVNGAVLQWLGDRPRFPGRIMIHQLLPHSPYIGDPPLAMGRWARGAHPFHRACHELERPDKTRRVDWDLVRRAYRGNVELVWDAVRQLASQLPDKRIIVTSDHGEILGEHGGKFGHEESWDFPELRQVPWLEVRSSSPSSTSSIGAKLEALGYT